MARMIETEIDIQASQTVVWNTLTDFDSYPEWSTFILAFEGDVVQGNTVTVHLDDGGGETTVKPRIIALDDPNKLVWLGKMGASWLLSAEHSFVLTDVKAGKTRVTHSEKFTGILVPFLWKTLDKRTRPAFVRFNEALRRRCEEQQDRGDGSVAAAS